MIPVWKASTSSLDHTIGSLVTEMDFSVPDLMIFALATAVLPARRMSSRSASSSPNAPPVHDEEGAEQNRKYLSTGIRIHILNIYIFRVILSK